MSQVNIENNPSLEHNLKGHKGAISDLSFHPINNQLASSSHDHSILLWNLSMKYVRCYSFKGHSDVVTSLKFSPNGQIIASGSQDRTVRLWVPTITGQSTSFRAHSSAVRTISFSPDSTHLISASNDKSIKKWDVKTCTFISSLTGHNNWVRCVDYSLDGKLIASCADDKTLRLWDVDSNQCIHTFLTSKGSGNYLAIHSSGNSVACAMNSGSVRIYDIRNHKLQQHYVLHDNTTCVSWHPNGAYLLTSGNEGGIRIVDVMEGRPLFTLKGHTMSVSSVKFCCDGEYFASAGNDKHILIWKTNFITSQCSFSDTDVS